MFSVSESDSEPLLLITMSFFVVGVYIVLGVLLSETFLILGTRQAANLIIKANSPASIRVLAYGSVALHAACHPEDVSEFRIGPFFSFSCYL